MSIQQGDVTTASASAPATAGGFRDPAGLTRWLKFFLYLAIALSALSIVSALLQLKMLNEVQAGRLLTPGEANSNDTREQIIAGVRFLQIVAIVVIFSMWIYRANYNARELGAADMKFSPGWAVGWYFIPVANLWKPYQAMCEIWQASADPAHWKQQARGPILPWWWGLFVLSNLISNASLRMMLRAKTVPDLILSTIVSAVSDAIDIAASAAALVLVIQIFRMQMARRAADAFA